jgi:hypothetical protein
MLLFYYQLSLSKIILNYSNLESVDSTNKKNMEYLDCTTHPNQEEMSIVSPQAESYLIQNERLASVFSFLAFVFTVALIGLFFGLLFNLSIITKLTLLLFLGISIIAGVAINYLDKRLSIKNSQAQIERILNQMD